MIHFKRQTTALEIEADCDWDSDPYDNRLIIIHKNGSVTRTGWIYYEGHPDHGGALNDFDKDGWTMPIEDFQKKWGIIKLYKLGKSHCSAGYTDRLNPEKSWWGHDPETLEKYFKWAKELQMESE